MAVEKNKGGRPRKELDQKQFENLCGLQCTREEICSFFDISEKTLDAWCKRTYGEGFSLTYDKKRQGGRISLRRMQWRLAERNAPMAIFLGKQFLGQTDNYNVHTNVKVDDDPITKALKESGLGPLE